MKKEPIKVGDYVRIKYMGKRAKIGRIEQILKKDPYYHDMQMYLVDVGVKHSNADYESSRIYEEDIIDYSSDIKELVHEGDYVNGYICRIIDNKMCNFDLNVMEWVRLEDFETMEYQIGKLKK